MQAKEVGDFYIEQVNTGCLSLYSYYIESEGEAVIIDPIREPYSYLSLAESRGTRIKYIFETHFHADFVSGHVELKEKTGAAIVYGPNAKPLFEHVEAKDSEEFSVGKIKLKVLHTPGHTLESSCYLLVDSQSKPHCIFTGDTLFLGEIGRPDLAVEAGELTKEDLASMLYNSLRDKIMPLDDNLIVYPAHGAGSSCGKHIQEGSSDSLGNQKKTNYALQAIPKSEFIKQVTSGLGTPPDYFFNAVAMNKEGYTPLDVLLQNELRALDVDYFTQLAQDEQNVILDTRTNSDVKKGYIEGSFCSSLVGNFAVTVAMFFKPKTPFILVTEEGKEKESALRLARVGYENVQGYLKGGVDAWLKAGKSLEKYEFINSDELKDLLPKKPHILDIRNPHEWQEGILEGAQLIPTNEIQKKYQDIPKDKPVYVHCRLGGRSFTIYTFLKRLGVKVVDVKGGIEAVKGAGVELSVPHLPNDL